MHKREYKQARIHYEKDRSENSHCAFSVDMEKVLLLPHMPQYKEAIFTRRLVTFNETFARLGSDSAPLAIIWHEAIAGRKDENVSSTWVTAIRHLAQGRIGGSREIILWADNCSAQNKCWTLYTALCSLINSPDLELDTIAVQYLEPGHTFMSADSFHHKVELSIKQCGQLHTYEDFVGVVEKVGTAVNMACSDFYSWPRSYGTSNRCKTERPLLEKVKVIRFQRGSVQMEWKSEHNEVSFRSAPFLRQKDERLIGLGVPIAFPQNEPRGIGIGKKNDIIRKLCRLMSPRSRGFWADLPSSDNVADLNREFD